MRTSSDQSESFSTYSKEPKHSLFTSSDGIPVIYHHNSISPKHQKTVVICLHPGGGCPSTICDSLYSSFLSRFFCQGLKDVFIVAPKLVNSPDIEAWQSNANQQVILDLINLLITSTYCTNVVLFGVQTGASGAYKFACRNPTLISGLFLLGSVEYSSFDLRNLRHMIIFTNSRKNDFEPLFQSTSPKALPGASVPTLLSVDESKRIELFDFEPYLVTCVNEVEKRVSSGISSTCLEVYGPLNFSYVNKWLIEFSPARLSTHSETFENNNCYIRVVLFHHSLIAIETFVDETVEKEQESHQSFSTGKKPMNKKLDGTRIILVVDDSILSDNSAVVAWKWKRKLKGPKNNTLKGRFDFPVTACSTQDFLAENAQLFVSQQSNKLFQFQVAKFPNCFIISEPSSEDNVFLSVEKNGFSNKSDNKNEKELKDTNRAQPQSLLSNYPVEIKSNLGSDVQSRDNSTKNVVGVDDLKNNDKNKFLFFDAAQQEAPGQRNVNSQQVVPATLLSPIVSEAEEDEDSFFESVSLQVEKRKKEEVLKAEQEKIRRRNESAEAERQIQLSLEKKKNVPVVKSGRCC
eukprot:GDKJ01005324.1.p1 GENE.GDKJ01005324.1~~GDKJ01005324.1.p1  ORF type:complete len:575 (+),score=114.12 GDKJ01005324.1:25-1749(+)